MIRLRKLLCFAVPIILFATSCSNRRVEFEPTDGQSIVFIGNTFAERLQHFNYFEPLLYKSFADRKFIVRNLGWSADEIGLQPRPFRFPSQDE